MNRRDLLKAVPILGAMVGTPVLIKGEEVGKSFAIDPGKKYLIFLNADMVDVNDFCRDCNAFPAGTVVHPVSPYGEKTIDDVVRIFQIE